MAPYRSRQEPKATREAPKAGLVADMVRQFADAFAFVRELVQNGIDAGASAIEVVVDRAPDGLTSVRVVDDGCGMTMDIIENALLVLFRSTKDEDPTKIGKYGVGFMSVLAIEPSEVTIDTWRDGHAYRVRLFPDHSYEIEAGVPRDGNGTSVAVTKMVPSEKLDTFWQDVTASLHRWCRHAELPIRFTLLDGTSPQPRRARADQPFDVRAVVSVRERFHDGMEIVIGPIAGSAKLPPAGTGEDAPACFAGFYNRGLTLHETTEPLKEELSQVRFKVKSAALMHTLSRDDVRRDNAFHLALSRAGALAGTTLRRAALSRLEEEAKKATRGEDAPLIAELVDIALNKPVSAEPEELYLPIAHPVAGMFALTPTDIQSAYQKILKLSRPFIPTATRPSALTSALAARGLPVLLAVRGDVAHAIERVTRGVVVAAPLAGALFVARELSGTDRIQGDDTLCTALGEALAHTGVGRVALVRFLDDAGPLGALVASPQEGAAEHAILASAKIPGAKWTKGSLLALNASAEVVACARRATSPLIAAHLLARYLLLQGPGLPSKISESLAARALSEIV